MSKPVIELIRVSTGAQAATDRTGIPMQRAVNRDTEKAFGLTIVHTIEYSDVSGASVLLSPEMRDLVSRIASPEIHGVVAREFSRLMRPEDFGDFALMQSFVNTRTMLYLPDGCIDFSTETGRLVGVVKAVIAGNERLEILRRMWLAKEDKRRQGGFSQSAVCLPYGVSFDKTKGWHYTPDAEKVAEAFRGLLTGMSYTAMAQSLGVSIPGLNIILRNPIYTGWRVIDEQRDPTPGAKRVKADGRQGDRARMKRAPENVIRLQVIGEPLISEPEFAHAQEILQANRRRHARTRTLGCHRYTYNGFLRCGMCHDLIYTHHRRADYYVCKARKLHSSCASSYMRRDLLEAGLDCLFTSRLTEASFLKQVGADFLESTPPTHPSARAGADVVRIEARRQRVREAYFDCEITRDERDARLAKIDVEESGVRQRGAAQLLKDASRTPDLKSLTTLLRVFCRFKTLERERKRALLTTIVPEIRVANYTVEGISLLIPRGDNLSHTDKGLLIPAPVYIPLGYKLLN